MRGGDPPVTHRRRRRRPVQAGAGDPRRYGRPIVVEGRARGPESLRPGRRTSREGSRTVKVWANEAAWTAHKRRSQPGSQGGPATMHHLHIRPLLAWTRPTGHGRPEVPSTSVRIRAKHLAGADRTSATQVAGLIELFMKWTEPSPKRVLTPPGCRLREPTYCHPNVDWLKHANIWTGWLSQSEPGPAGLVPDPVTNPARCPRCCRSPRGLRARWG